MRLKSEFESLRKRERFSEPISFAAELHIISTLRPGPNIGSHVFFFGIPLLFLDLTLPPASPPRSRGLQEIIFLPSRGSEPIRPTNTSKSKLPKRTSGHLKVEILNGPLDTSKSKFSTDLWTPQSRNSKRTSGHFKVEMIIRRPDKSCNRSDLRTHQSRNSKPTSGHRRARSSFANRRRRQNNLVKTI